MPARGTIHRRRPLFQHPLRHPPDSLSGAETTMGNRKFLFCVDSRERLKARHQRIVIKSSADGQPSRLHRNDQANFGSCGHGLRGRRSAAGPSPLAGVYDMNGGKELSATGTSVRFTNPHGSRAFAVRNQDGPSAEWVMTLGSATALAQRGIRKTGPNALHTGDEIKVKVLPARDGSPLGFLKTAIMPDGRVIRISAGKPERLDKEGESSWQFYERSLGQVSRSQSP
jgi:Family of unknown function (DUF6152)